jgi:hypothetical protein
MLRRSIAIAALTLASGQAFAQCDSTKLLASERSASDSAGWALATGGDWMFMGAPFRSVSGQSAAGKVFVYQRNPSTGVWSQANMLQMQAPVASARFGSAIAYDLPVAVIGAPNAGNGSAVIVDHIGNFFGQPVQFNGGTPGDQFGASVAISGDVIMIGAPRRETAVAGQAMTDAGAALIFIRESNQWVHRQSVFNTVPNVANNDFLGTSVAVHGEIAAAGGPGISGAVADSGAVSVLTRNNMGYWNVTATLRASDEQAGAEFGASMAMDEGLIAVGAPRYDANGLADKGAVYIFRRQNNSWVETQKLVATDANQTAFFGTTIHVSGGRIAVTAPGARKSYIFQQNAQGEFHQQYRFTDPDGFEGDSFGRSAVIAAGNAVIVGDPGDDPSNVTNAGAAYRFPIPTNVSDSCGGAAPLSAGAIYQGCTTNMTLDGSASCGTQEPSGPDTWFSFTPAASGTVTLRTQGSAFDTVLSVHSGCPGTSATAIACNDDSSTGVLWSNLTFNAVAGQNYRVRLAGFGGASGQFTLEVGSIVPGCYANCDLSTSAPTLNVADFTCFLQRFAAGEPYANCDQSTSAPTLNVADFTCFLQRFAAGCN